MRVQQQLFREDCSTEIFVQRNFSVGIISCVQLNASGYKYNAPLRFWQASEIRFVGVAPGLKIQLGAVGMEDSSNVEFEGWKGMSDP